jgi:hypothetical protein
MAMVTSVEAQQNLLFVSFSAAGSHRSPVQQHAAPAAHACVQVEMKYKRIAKTS